jgi:hypothetical protein
MLVQQQQLGVLVSLSKCSKAVLPQFHAAAAAAAVGAAGQVAAGCKVCVLGVNVYRVWLHLHCCRQQSGPVTVD